MRPLTGNYTLICFSPCLLKQLNTGCRGGLKELFGICCSGSGIHPEGPHGQVAAWALQSTLVCDPAEHLEHSGGASLSCFVFCSRPWAVLFAILLSLLQRRTTSHFSFLLSQFLIAWRRLPNKCNLFSWSSYSYLCLQQGWLFGSELTHSGNVLWDVLN